MYVRTVQNRSCVVISRLLGHVVTQGIQITSQQS